MNAQNHNQEKHDEVVPDSTPCLENGPTISKRRLLKVGISAVPIVLTLTSRPVLAWHCKTPSVAASANTSHAVLEQSDEGTQTIAYWTSASYSSSTIAWPGCNKSTVTLGQMFGVTDTTLCKTVIRSTATDNATMLKKYLIAAMLNVRLTNAKLCLTEEQIKLMYVKGPSGQYQPLSGSPIYWGFLEIKAYLQNNWIVTG